ARVELDRALEVHDAVTQAVELLDLDVAERREPPRVRRAERLPARDDAAERARVGDGVEPAGAGGLRRAEEAREAREGAGVVRLDGDGLDERLLRLGEVLEADADVGELEEDVALDRAVVLDGRELLEELRDLELRLHLVLRAALFVRLVLLGREA